MGFLRLSKVGLVTPLRDGMNLVAKEYVAAQSPEDPGVLVLSRFAGAAQELSGALLVNPYDIEGVSDALARALAMSKDERRERWQGMYQRLKQFDIVAWRESYLQALHGAEHAA
jgi:trehalose 6-phosphate synthase